MSSDVSIPLSSSTLDGPKEYRDRELIHCSVEKYHWEPPSDYEQHPYRPHQGEGSQYLRDFILGVNDGLISTYLLIVTVVSGSNDVRAALLAGIAGAIAGCFAMGLGEYIATKSQSKVSASELELELEHFAYHRDIEIEQLRNFFQGINLKGDLLEAVVSEISRNEDSMLKCMKAFEFGIQDDQERNPLIAMAMSGRLFLIGSLPSLLPFFFVHDAHIGLAIATVLVGIALFGVGAYKTKTTRGNPWLEGGENFIFGILAGGISYLVGFAFDSLR
jgi:VIT1/CCC1 family predicted Fe2+/Mn2+ transporter